MTTLRKLPMIAPSTAMNAQTIGSGTLMTLSIGGSIRENIVTRRWSSLVLKFPQQLVLQRSVTRGELRDCQACACVAKAALQNEAADESERTGCRHLQGRRTLAVLEHLLRPQRRIALIDHPAMMIGVAHRIMKQIARQYLDSRASVHDD